MDDQQINSNYFNESQDSHNSTKPFPVADGDDPHKAPSSLEEVPSFVDRHDDQQLYQTNQDFQQSCPMHSGPVTGQKYKNQSQNFNVIMLSNNYIDIIKQFKTV